MDGTLFNTESVHADAMILIADKYQIKAPYSPEVVHALMMGKADYLVFDIIKDWEGTPKDWTAQDFINEKNDGVIELLKKTEVQRYFAREVEELIRDAKSHGLYLALITSSEKVVTQALMKIAGLDQFFELVLTRDDCPKHKPDPWPYLKALELTGFAKEEVIIFEDSTVGLEAATATGSNVIKVEWY